MTAATTDVVGVRAGAYAAELQMPPELAPVLRSTLRDLIVDVNETSASASVARDPDGSYRVSADGRLYQSGLPADAVPDYVVRMLLLAELDANAQRLHLHGGLVAEGDAGVLVSGISGSGKTTLITALLRAGFDYVTDERIAIDVERGVATGFAKPVSLVPGSFHLFPELDPEVTGAGHATERVWQVPASSFGRGTIRAEAPVRLVVSVRYEEGAPLRVEPLHPASAAAELLADSPGRERFGPDAIAVAGTLCAHATCVRVTYHQFADAERAIRELLTDTPRPVELEVLAPTPARRRHSRGGRLAASHVLARQHDRPLVMVDGRALAYTPDGAKLVEFDEVATAWLMLVDGRSTVAELVDAVQQDTSAPRLALEAGALKVLRGLVSHGLVARV